MAQSVVTKEGLLDIIRLGIFKREVTIVKGLAITFKLLTKGEVDAAAAATGKRLAENGIHPMDAFARTPLVQEEELARAILEWNGVKTTEEENRQALQSMQSQLFILIWNAFTSVALLQQVEFAALEKELKNSSGSQDQGPSGDSSSASLIPPGSKESESAPTSSPTSSTSGVR